MQIKGIKHSIAKDGTAITTEAGVQPSIPNQTCNDENNNQVQQSTTTTTQQSSMIYLIN